MMFAASDSGKGLMKISTTNTLHKTGRSIQTRQSKLRLANANSILCVFLIPVNGIAWWSQMSKPHYENLVYLDLMDKRKLRIQCLVKHPPPTYRRIHFHLLSGLHLLVVNRLHKLVVSL